MVSCVERKINVLQSVDHRLRLESRGEGYRVCWDLR
jgi:hypothetical protein